MTGRIGTAVVLLCVTMAASSCAKKQPQSAGDYYGALEDQSRNTLRQSLFKSDQEVLSNEEIEAILSSKIELPRQAHLTILRLGSENEVLTWAFLGGSERPLSNLAETARLSRVSWLPSLLVPERLTVPLLREAAARFQADLLLIYRTPCQRFSEYRLFGIDESRTYCAAEAVLLDVRTGIIPYSGVAAKALLVEKDAAAVNLYESMKRAEAAAIDEALSELARELAAFLDGAP